MKRSLKCKLMAGLAFCFLFSGCRSDPSETSASPDPEAEQIQTVVTTDWSLLTPHQPTREVRVDWAEALVPSSQYGALLPFPGQALTDASGEKSYVLWGLMTLQGQVVVDPIYSTAEPLQRQDPISGKVESLPVLILTQRELDASTQQPVFRSALAAQDGSWVTDLVYTFDENRKTKDQLFALRDGSTLVMIDVENGMEVSAIDLSKVAGKEAWAEILSTAQFGDNRITASYHDWDKNEFYGLCFDYRTGVSISLPNGIRDLGKFADGRAPAADNDNKYGYIDKDGDWAVEPQFREAGVFSDSIALARGFTRPGYFTIDVFGQTVYQPSNATRAQRWGNYWYFINSDEQIDTILDSRHRTVNTQIVGAGGVRFLGDGWVAAEKDAAWLLSNGATTYTLSPDLGRPEYVSGEKAIFHNTENGYWYLGNPDGRHAARIADAASVELGRDAVTGETYLAVTVINGGIRLLRATDGAVLLDVPSSGAFAEMYGGVFLILADDYVTVSQTGGAVLFRQYLDDGID